MKFLKTYFPARRSLGVGGLILISYFLLAILFTWPLATRLTTHGFGHDEDSGYHLWHNWWFKYSLFDLHQSPLTTDYIFHPQKINLIYDANAFVFAALTLPFQFLTNNVVLSSNLVFLFSFALSGLFAFLLANYLITNYSISFLVGTIFAFNPYTTAQAIDGHTNLTSTWIIPLYTLLLLRSLIGSNPINPKGPLAKRVRPYWFPMAAGLVAALQLYNDFTYTAFMIIETGLILCFFFFEKIRRRDFVSIYQYTKTIILIGLTAVVISLPILWEVFKVSREGFRAGSPLWVQNVWSADFLTFFRPNDQTTFLPNPWTPNVGTVEGTAFLGYSVLTLLLAFGLWQIVRSRLTVRQSGLPAEVPSSGTKEGERWHAKLLIFLSVSFFVLMLGPSVHYGNEFVFNIFGQEIIFPLPYILLHKIPFLGETQEPARLFPFFILSLSVLSGWILQKTIQRLRPPVSSLLLTSYFLLLIFEYLTIPFPTLDLSSKPIFDIIRNDPENKAVLTLPLGFNSGNYVLGQSPIGSLQFYQTYFQKPSFRATVARLPYSNFEYYQKLLLLPYLLDPEQPVDTEKLKTEKATIKKIFKDQLHIKYILVFEQKYKKSMGETYLILSEILEARAIYNRDGIRGFLLN